MVNGLGYQFKKIKYVLHAKTKQNSRQYLIVYLHFVNFLMCYMYITSNMSILIYVLSI